MSAPQYLAPASQRPEPPTPWEMVKATVMAPQNREGNLNILRAATLFVGGVVLVRSSWGGILLPPL